MFTCTFKIEIKNEGEGDSSTGDGNSETSSGTSSPEKKGCGSALGAGSALLIGAAAIALIAKKKSENR